MKTAGEWVVIGDNYFKNKNYNEALKCYNIALRSDGTRVFIWNKKGETLLNLKNFSGAIECFKRALEIDPNYKTAENNKTVAENSLKHQENKKNQENIDKWNNLAWDEKDPLKKIEYCNNVLELDPNDLRGLWELGEAYLTLKNYKKAISCYDEVLKTNPYDFQTFYKKGRLYSIAGVSSEAIACYCRALEDGDSFNILFMIGELYYGLELFENSLKYFNKTLKCPSSCFDRYSKDEIWHYKGEICSELRKYEEAIKCYDKYLKKHPNEKHVWSSIGDAYYHLNKYEEAINWYEKCLKKQYSPTYIYKHLGTSYYKLGKYEEAQKYIDKSSKYDSDNLKMENDIDTKLKEEPNNIKFLKEKGRILFLSQKYEEAIGFFNRLLSLNPKDFGANMLMGYCYDSIQNYTKAIFHYNNALKLDLKNSNAWNALGDIYCKTEKYADAISCYNKSFELNPEDIETLIKKGTVLKKFRKYSEALKCFENVLHINPTHHEAIQSKNDIKTCIDLGITAIDGKTANEWYVLAINEKKPYKKIEYYNKTLDLNPNDIAAWINLGSTYEDIGNFKKSVECCDNALKINPDLEAAQNMKKNIEPRINKNKFEVNDLEVNSDMYSIKVLEISSDGWDYQKTQDLENFKEGLPNSLIDKRGIIGFELFELTLDNLGAGIDRGLANSRIKNLEVEEYNCMCPELETFITVVLWLNYNNDQQIAKNEDCAEILTKYIDNNDPNKKCVMKGNYRIRNDNLGDIVPFRGEFEIREKHKHFYEWRRAPFLKRSGEIFNIPSSPAFMSSFPDNDSGNSSNTTIFTTPFKIEMMSENGLELVIPSATSYKKGIISIKRPENGLPDQFLENKKEWYQGLFQEKISKISGEYIRTYELLDASIISGDDFLGHFLVQRLYYNYLKNQDFKICTESELMSRYKIITEQMHKTYGLDSEVDFERFKLLYLDNYFIIINNNVYYKPYIFKEMDLSEYLLFLKYIVDKEKFEQENIQNMEFLHKFKEYFDKFIFLKTYNKYSKNELIGLLTGEGGVKWKV